MEKSTYSNRVVGKGSGETNELKYKKKLAIEGTKEIALGAVETCVLKNKCPSTQKNSGYSENLQEAKVVGEWFLDIVYIGLAI